MIKDDLFFAWLDGELEHAAAAEVEAAVAAHPELQRKAEAHRALGTRLQAAFAPVAEAAVPPALAAAARPQAAVIDLAAARERRAARPISVGTQWAAMAATLVLGIAVGSFVRGNASSPLTIEDGRLVAADELEAALYTRLASAPAQEGPRIGLTFRDAKGSLCRSFTDQGSSGLACLQGGDWRIRGLFQAGEGQQGEYRMAAGADPRLAELIGSTMAGEPLDAAAERKAIEDIR